VANRRFLHETDDLLRVIMKVAGAGLVHNDVVKRQFVAICELPRHHYRKATGN